MQKNKTENKIFLSFDTEEFTIPMEFNSPDVSLNNNTTLCANGVKRVLDLLEEKKVKATFFVTGYFAVKEKQIVKEIVRKGHEVGSHSYFHTRKIVAQRDVIKKDIQESKDILEKVTGNQIVGFRAPRCLVDQQLLDILDEVGFQYDSSVHPAIVPGAYYNTKYPLNPYFPDKENIHLSGERKILEIPITVIPWIRFPISWWWMRNIGLWITKMGTKWNIKKRHVILYFHPWEFVKIDPIQKVPNHIIHKTGEQFLSQLSEFINYCKENNMNFDVMKKIECRGYQKS